MRRGPVLADGLGFGALTKVPRVNVSDIAAMGGRPIALVDAIWAPGAGKAALVLEGMKAASEIFGVPIVGGHSNLSCDRAQLSAAILGSAKKS